MIILLVALITLRTLVNGEGREVFPVHDDGLDINQHFITAHLNSRSPHISSRIGGGLNARPGELPFVVQIRYNFQYHCTGALIHGLNQNQIVLTTAECVTAPAPSRDLLSYDLLLIVGGKYHMDGSYFYEQITQPSKIICHEQWDRFNIINDLAVIFLRTPFTLNALVHTIELPTTVKLDYPHNGYPLKVGSWGFVKDGVHKPIMQTLRLPVLEWQTCYDAYYLQDGSRHIHKDSTLCARDAHVGQTKNLCHGDWGAPARAYDNGTEYLAGIFSWAEKPCGRNGYPSLFQKMTHFKTWVWDTSVNDPYWGKK